jgi:hypothetical protein
MSGGRDEPSSRGEVIHITGNVLVGKKDVDIATPSHVRGVHEGNWPRKVRRTAGVRRGEAEHIRVPTRSTGINPEARWPIDPTMPKLTPP